MDEEPGGYGASRLRHWVAVGLALVLALGIFPHDWEVLTGAGPGPRRTSIRVTMEILIFLAMVSPAVPLAALLMGRYRPRWLSKFLVVAGMTLGPVLVLLSAVFLPDGSDMIRLGVAAAVDAAVIGTGILIGAGFRGRNRAVGWAGLGLGALAGAWSLAVVPRVVAAANRVADGRPFCVNFHERGKTLDSLLDLRGAYFIATATGYKDSSNWYFHAVLLVEGPGGVEPWNWSYRHMGFEPVTRPGLLVERVDRACTPVADFWHTF